MEFSIMLLLTSIAHVGYLVTNIGHQMNDHTFIAVKLMSNNIVEYISFIHVPFRHLTMLTVHMVQMENK